MRIIWGLIIVLAWTGTSVAKETYKTEIKGHVYHRLDECAFERGIAIANYNFRTKRNVKPILEITDVCFDRSSGTIYASESENDLTLVRQDTGDDGNGQPIDYFEVLTPNSAAYQRWKADAGRYDIPGADRRHDSVGFSYQRPTSELFDWKTTGTQHDADVNLRGYLAEHWGNRANTDGFYFYVRGHDSLQYERARDQKFRGRETPIVSWQGASKLENGQLEASLITADDEFSTGDGELRLTIDENGRVHGGGVFRAKNTRLAGTNDFDWKTTEWRIEALVGHVVGKQGKTIQAIALARGETIDYDGHVNPVYASVEITGYDREYATSWQDPTIANAFAEIGFGQLSDLGDGRSPNDLELERQLNIVGFNPGEIDGVFDDQTFAAIQKFQGHLRLPQEGLISEQQRNLLALWANAIQTKE